MENVKYIPGDLVVHYGAVSMIDAIYCDQEHIREAYCLNHLDDINKIYRVFDSHDLEPIFLTPVILKDNGWKESIPSSSYNNEDYSNFKKKGFPSLSENSDYTGEWFEFRWGCTETKINYVHQLQHLLFGLGLNSDLKV